MGIPESGMNRVTEEQYAPFFSIIVPIYNRVSFIKSGVAMMLGQSFGDYEVILVDDGSADGSAEVCDEAAKSEKITVIHKDNGGAGAARNAGLDAARGEYICFFDIDDSVPSCWLETIYRHVGDKNADLLIYGYRELNKACGTVSEFAFDDKTLRTNDELKAVYSESLSGIAFNNGFVWNKVYKREFLSLNGIRFPNLRIQQDEVFNHAVYKKAVRTRLVSDILYNYYVYDTGTGRSAVIAERTDIFKAVRRSFMELYDFWGLDDMRLLTYIHRRYVQNILYNRNKTGLGGVCEYADEIFSQTEVTDSAAYLRSVRMSQGEQIDRLYGIAIERKSKPLFLLAEIRERTVRAAKGMYRRMKQHKPFACNR